MPKKQTQSKSSRKRLVLIAAVTLVAAWTAAGVRHVGPESIVVRDSAIIRVTPTLLEAGWHFVPRGLFSLHEYNRGHSSLTFGEESPVSFVTSEGATVIGAGRLEYEILASGAASLHARSHADVEGWLASRIHGALDATLSDPAHSPLTRDKVSAIETAGGRLLETMVGTDVLDIDSLTFKRLGYEGSDLVASGPRPEASRKFLWLAIDSYDWDIINPLMAAGRLPNLKRLMDDGSWGNLQAFPPLLSPVIWTTAATGKRPDKHGIIDFVATDPATGAVLPVTSTLRRSRAFWNILDTAGLSVGVIAWWASFPAEPLDSNGGFMATDRISYQLFQGRIKEDTDSDDPLKTSPPELYREIAPLIAAPADIDAREVSRFIDVAQYEDSFSEDDDSRVNEFRTVLASARTYSSIGMKLFTERPTDVRVIYFEGPDTSSHLFMPFVAPPREGIPAKKVEWFGNVVPEVYVYQDELIGQFVDAYADENTTVLISSDHGFKIDDNRPAEDSRIGGGNAADWHTREGIIVLSGKDIKKGERILGATILDIVPTMLALYGLPIGEDMDGKVLTGALAPGFLDAHPLETIATYEQEETKQPTRVAGMTQDDQELLAKLESLGYVQQDMPTAHINQGTILLQGGKYEEAIEEFKAALRGGDRDPIRMNLARALRLAGRTDESNEQLDILAERGHNPSAVLSERALIAGDLEDWDKAERLFKQARTEDPENPEIEMNLGRLYERMNRTDEAAEAFRASARKEPTYSEAYNKLGILLGRTGKTDEAIAVLKEAIEVNADSPGPYNNLGLIYREKGNVEAARDILETGLTMAPRSTILHNSLGSLLYDEGQVDKAIAAFEEALKHDPGYAEAVSNLATIHSRRGDAANTVKYLAQLIELEPENEEAHTSLALMYLRAKRVDEAVAVTTNLLDALPENLRANLLLGEIRLKQGRHGEAVGFYEKAGEINPDIPRIWNSLATCYVALERHEDARRALERSLGLDPDQPDVSKQLISLGN